MKNPTIAVIIPHYQKQAGLLATALASVFSQTESESLHVYIIDDESPISAQSEVDSNPAFPKDQLTVIRKANGGAGSARNMGLDQLGAHIQHVAFLDSDDKWRPEHIKNALQVLNAGFDAYFSDWWSFNFPEQTNFQRIRTLQMTSHRQISSEPDGFALGVTPIEHILSDGGGLIQTSTVVYRFDKFPKLRFREEFYNGQDFFFWMDLGELGAEFSFSNEVDCDNGEGINIYQGAGWGTDRSMQRLRNELFVWTSVPRFYQLTETQAARNKATIRNLENGVVRDIMYRLRRRKSFAAKHLLDIIKFDPSFMLYSLQAVASILMEKLPGGANKHNNA